MVRASHGQSSTPLELALGLPLKLVSVATQESVWGSQFGKVPFTRGLSHGLSFDSVNKHHMLLCLQA